MIDSLVRMLPMAMKNEPNGLPPRYAVVTLHRPSNVDNSQDLRRVLECLVSASEDLAVVFPVHPRTRQRIRDFGIETKNLLLVEPMPYLEFLALQARATVVITDSGGIQEETTYLGVPCLTLRRNTERPITVEVGTNVLIGDDMDKLRTELSRIITGNAKRGAIPPLWDGHASERIADVIVQTTAGLVRGKQTATVSSVI
jgi:UDP-N-acetylglucosamine 2-epimerase (non-hydrolysing)